MLFLFLGIHYIINIGGDNAMKKWMLVSVAVVLLACYGVFLYGWFTRPIPEATLSTEIVPTEPTTETIPLTQTLPTETIPVETVSQETEPIPVKLEVPAVPIAKHIFVYNCGDSELLYTKGGQTDRIAPASLTKLLTAYVALQYLDPDSAVTIGEEVTWIDPASSTSHVEPGDSISVALLIQGMMMQSGNDAAYATAVAAGRVIAGDPSMDAKRALDTFIAEMNTLAQAHGLTGSHFVTPDGLDADGHYTTPEDMLAIALLAMEEPLICHYAGLSQVNVVYENGKNYMYKNTNYLLHPNSPYYCPDAYGLKTGYTSKAGSCLLALFNTDERQLLIGIFGCPTYEDRVKDATILYNIFRS